MRKFIKRLPVYNGKITKELVGIAFHHFMDGEKMYFDDGIEITSQAGFKYAVIHDLKIKMTEKQLDKMIAEYNKQYVTPEVYREFKQLVPELKSIIENNKKIMERKATRSPKVPREKRKNYYQNIKTIIKTFNEQGSIMWSGETVEDKDRLIKLIESYNLFSKHTIKKLAKEVK